MNGQEHQGVIEVGQLAKIRRLHSRESIGSLKTSPLTAG